MAVHKHYNTGLPSNAQDSSGNMFFGAGNPANPPHALFDTSDDGTIQLALEVIHRQGDAYAGTPRADGSVDINVNHGSQPGNPNRAEWNFTYSVDNLASQALINTLSPQTQGTGHDIHLVLKVADPQGTMETVFDYHLAMTTPTWNNAGVMTPAHLAWVDSNNQVAIGDDGTNPGTVHVTQNSENVAFWDQQISDIVFQNTQNAGSSYAHGNPLNPNVQPFGHANFDISLIEVAKGGIIGSTPVQQDMTLHVHVI